MWTCFAWYRLRDRSRKISGVLRTVQRPWCNQCRSRYLYPGDGFDKKRSLKAFQETIYPLLRANCSGCHSTENRTASGAQAPLHADADVNLAHEYALTRVNFRQPENSKLVVRMSIDRHNCFDTSCAAAGKKMLAAVVAWRDRVAG